MTKLQIFTNDQFGDVRIAMNESNEPLFCLADVCKAMGITNVGNVRSRLDNDDVRLMDTVDSLGRKQELIFVTESGLYDTILRSDSEKAKPFRKWVTSNVLPTIRKHGAYMTNDTLEKALTSPDFLIQLATNLKDEQSKRIAAENEVTKLKPKAQLMDKVLDTGEKIDIGQVAKILGLPFGRNTLFKKLREAGIFFKNRNEPKQEYITRGYFYLKEKWIDRKSHDDFTVIKVLVSQKGLEFIYKLFNPNTTMEIANN